MSFLLGVIVGWVFLLGVEYFTRGATGRGSISSLFDWFNGVI